MEVDRTRKQPRHALLRLPRKITPQELDDWMTVIAVRIGPTNDDVVVAVERMPEIMRAAGRGIVFARGCRFPDTMKECVERRKGIRVIGVGHLMLGDDGCEVGGNDGCGLFALPSSN
ncbi:hypothetical protein ACHAXS_007180 [Conticribra weissflogii]